MPEDKKMIEPIDAPFDDVARSLLGKAPNSKKPREVYATHTGELTLGSVVIPCHVLDDGTRVLSGRGMQNSLGFSKSASGLALGNFIESKLSDFIDEETMEKVKSPIPFIRVGSGGSAPDTNGFDATVFVDICDAVIQANKADRLTQHQAAYAEQAEAIIRSLAKTGIVALVDEATGYQYQRESDALQRILDKFLNEERRKWSKTFPDEFWQKLVKIKGYDSYLAIKRPSFVGHWVNDIVYSRLAPGIKDKLSELNPRSPSGNRQGKHHQHLTDDYGLPELKDHLKKVMVLMDASSSKKEFEKLLNKSMPKYGGNFELPYDEE
ncbi:P63C domain-containing protein [Sphingorhabdus sp.]|jgi:hypothetical protein|uniref:P63C domain-containing protein n=1 Tax=Sphingorhabdus sp. TaxID=1902408 RepID=UPI003D81C1D2